MRCLLTGAGGFVGHHTLEHLLVNTDWDIVCTDSFRHRGKTDRIAEVLDAKPQYRSRVSVVTHDLTVPFSTQLVERLKPIDVVINMASESHVDRSITDPGPFILNNCSLTVNMFDLCTQLNPDVIIQVSTDEVYGPAYGDYRHVEWDPIIPSNPYAASKAAQEAISTAYWRTYGLPIVISNTMNIVGERQDPEKFVPMTIKRVLEGEKMTIHASPTGEVGSRFYLHARNQADALLFLANAAMDGKLPNLVYGHDSKAPERYHVVGEREVDNLEMANLIAQAAGRPLQYELVDFHSSRPGHDLRYALDGTKLAELGWVPPVPLDTSIERTVKWTLDRQDWLLD